MLNRLFTPNFAIEPFSDELMLTILSHLTDQELMDDSLVSRDFYRLINDDALWKIRFIRSFGKPLLVSNTDIKAQYIAATLYRRGKAQSRPDLAQQIFIPLYRHVKIHQGKSWANYYLANLHLHGYGTQKSVEYGCHLLHECAKSAHPAAIHDLVTQFPEHIQRLTQVEFDYYRHLLSYAHKHGAKHFSLSLAALSRAGVNGASDLAMEISWLQRAIEANLCEAIERYVEILIHQQPDRLPSDIVDELITQHADKPTILGELHYCLALAYSEQNNKLACQNALVRAIELHTKKAMAELAGMYAEDATEAHDQHNKDQLNSLAIDNYKIGLRHNHVACTQGYFDRMIFQIEENCGEYKPLFDSLIGSFHQGNPLVAILIHQLHASLPGYSFIDENCELMLWLQLAAQCGKPDAVEAIIKLADKDTPNIYALCAVAIIHQFGILGSDKYEPNPQKASKYLEKAFKLNLGAVKEYFETGKALGLLSIHSIEMIQECMQAFAIKNAACRFI